uniref:Uncharacterized protein n=1 Tax=Zeugodacus cucurbitae TaxID=28588 RepID=A0A0A1WZJ9_ZEUCU
MNNLDHVKNFYPENYKLDLSETMKAALSKGPGGVGVGVGVGGLGGGGGGAGSAGSSGGGHGMGAAVSHGEIQTGGSTGIPGVGYVTEKLYMLLQLYLQNKGWNPSAELLQCFTDLKDNAMLPSAAYLQVLANRLTLDAQGRLILRENGKIVLPFEHFANAVMLKHMSGPHGLHLSVEATVRAVIESYTIGRENFGMEKEFIIEVVQSCPSPACRYYKNHLGMSPLPFMDQQFPGVNHADFLQHLPHLPPPPPHSMVPGSTNSGVSSAGSSSSGGGSSSIASSSVGGSVSAGGEVDLTKSSTASHSSTGKVPVVPSQLQMLTKQQQNSIQSQLSQLSAAAAAAAHHQQQQQQAAAAAAAAAAAKQQQQAQAAAVAQQQQQQQLTAALLQQQQSRALAQQSLEKFNNLSALEKQRVLQQLDPKHFDPMAVAAAAANLQMQGINDFRVAAIAAAAAQAAGGSPMLPSASTAACGGAPITSSSALNSGNSGMTGSGNNSHNALPSTISGMNNSAGSNSSGSSAGHNPVNNSSTNNIIGVSGSIGSNNAHHSHQLPPPSQSPSAHSSHSSSSSSSHSTEQIVQKNVELLRSNLESIESNKDLLALHNGAWTVPDNNRDPLPVGQDKIVRIFTELMRNMARMKTYIRPSMCKPYGKQSESLQKTLLDTIQIVQTLRNCLPAPHIPVSSWKSESEGNTGLITTNNGSVGNTGNNIMGGVGAGLMVANRVENLTN